MREKKRSNSTTIAPLHISCLHRSKSYVAHICIPIRFDVISFCTNPKGKRTELFCLFFMLLCSLHFSIPYTCASVYMFEVATKWKTSTANTKTERTKRKKNGKTKQKNRETETQTQTCVCVCSKQRLIVMKWNSRTPKMKMKSERKTDKQR